MERPVNKQHENGGYPSTVHLEAIGDLSVARSQVVQGFLLVPVVMERIK